MNPKPVLIPLVMLVFAALSMQAVSDDFEKDDQAFVTGSSVNLRSAPNAKARILAKLPIGSRVTFDHISGDWAYVSVPDPKDETKSQSGYVLAEFLDQLPPQVDAMISFYDNEPEENLSERRTWAERAMALDPTDAGAQARLLEVLEKIGDRRAYAAARQRFALPFRDPRPAVDSRGWIDVWELQRDIQLVVHLQERMLHELPGWCREPEEAEGKQRSKEEIKRAQKAEDDCLKERWDLEDKVSAAIPALNAAWLLALKAAMNRGDPVAEVILRNCDTSGLIDRAGIEADCSPEAAKKEVARTRLEAIGFYPALSRLNNEDIYNMTFATGRKPARPWKGRGPYADSPGIASIERVLDAMGKGDLAASRVQRYCNQNAAAFGRCLYLDLMVRAICSHAIRFYTSCQLDDRSSFYSLDLSLYRPQPTRPYLVRDGVYSFDNETRGRPVFRAITPRDFQRDLDGHLQNIARSIDADLKREPRWAVFLVERDGRRVRFGTTADSRTQRRE